ncbi:MAG: hypothetical protein WCR56_01270 [Bacilli bacterium]|jgi:DNA polymerase elongation subunit (family B)
MPTWGWILIIVAGVLVLYGLSALVIYFIMKGIQKKTFKALDDLVPYEKNRLKKLLECKETLERMNYFHSQPMADLLDKQEAIANGSTIDMASLKGQNDFLTIYFQKFFKEKHLVLKNPEIKVLNDEITKTMYIDPAAKDSPYKRYDDLAFRYNSYLGMMILAPFTRGAKNPRAPIL